MSSQGLVVTECRTAHGLVALRREWDELLERSERATVFQSWEWNAAWWQAFGRGKRLRIMEIRRGSELVGLAPLYVSMHLGTPLRRLAFLGTGTADYLDAIAPDAEAGTVCEALLSHLSETRGFDLADLQQLAPSSVIRAHWGERRAWPGGRIGLRDQEPCPYVPLARPLTWDGYARGLGKKMRSNIGYYERLLTRTFEHAETRLADAEDLQDAMAALFDLHQKRWNAALLPGVLGGRRVQAFHRDLAGRLLSRGWLRLYVTRVEGRPVAALYCFRFRERTSYYLGGFAPDLAKYSLGTVLTAAAIRGAIDEGCTEFDFLRGDEPYKQRWQPQMRTNARLVLSRPRSLRSGAMLRLNRFESYVEHKAKAFARRRQRKSSAG